MIESDYKTLVKKGNLGYYQSCEVTQIFIHNKTDKSNTNLYTLVTFEEKPFISRNQKFIGNPKKIDSINSVGIDRYLLSISEVKEVFETLLNNNKWKEDKTEDLILGNLVPIRKQYIPAKDNHRITNALKNNFNNGSYIIEFFDEEKSHYIELFDKINTKRFVKIAEEIKKEVFIDLLLLKDRIGNIIFQFPNDILYASLSALSSRDGINLEFKWHKNLTRKPKCIVDAECILDGNYMGVGSIIYNKSGYQQIMVGNLKGSDKIKVIRTNPNLLLYEFNGSFPNSLSLSTTVANNHEPRQFLIDEEVLSIPINSQPMISGGKKLNEYIDHINGVVYEEETNRLEVSGDFRQYTVGMETKALKDIREIIKKNNQNGVYVWDPYIRANEILKTLFFSNTAGVELRALGAFNKNKKTDEEQEMNLKIIEMKQEEVTTLEENGIVNSGLNLEYRIQHGKHGVSFHDRFLIFPGNKNIKPVVYSLGASVNKIGAEHHIIQKVMHPQRILDEFEKLWDKLNHNDCIVWKYPKT